jgi:hypothetical protein
MPGKQDPNNEWLRPDVRSWFLPLRLSQSQRAYLQGPRARLNIFCQHEFEMALTSDDGIIPLSCREQKKFDRN